jgi:NhaP-type Na+/H+ and K+/H+ antiporter
MKTWNVVLTIAVVCIIFGVGPFASLHSLRLIIWPGLAWAALGILVLCIAGFVIQVAVGGALIAPVKLMQWLYRRSH